MLRPFSDERRYEAWFAIILPGLTSAANLKERPSSIATASYMTSLNPVFRSPSITFKFCLERLKLIGCWVNMTLFCHQNTSYPNVRSVYSERCQQIGAT